MKEVTRADGSITHTAFCEVKNIDQVAALLKLKKEIIIIVSVSVLCVAVPTGLHTVSRNSVPKNVKR